ncbi:MAG: ATP-binding protein, partial [Rhodospirillales bacterium]|nr:ATP-binding protein [Rhodospirillales bacterium]
MAVTARKYNPGFLSIDELVAIFCVRTAEYESLIEALRECSGSANTHQIVIGPRGSGKTSLLLRVAAEVIRDADLSARFFPIVFAEESYEVSTAGEFWLECLSRLADQAPAGKGGVDLHLTFGELRAIQDDRTLEARCLGVLQDFADREEKRLVLIVENLNMMFRDMGDDDAGWRLRKALQTEPRIVLLASATSRFDQMNDPKEALYELFRVIRLHPLDTEDCATLWQTVSGQAQAPQTIQALRILTGGSPRLLTIVARFGANLSFRELMADLLDLVDDHTEYFKS